MPIEFEVLSVLSELSVLLISALEPVPIGITVSSLSVVGISVDVSITLSVGNTVITVGRTAVDETIITGVAASVGGVITVRVTVISSVFPRLRFVCGVGVRVKVIVGILVGIGVAVRVAVGMLIVVGVGVRVNVALALGVVSVLFITLGVLEGRWPTSTVGVLVILLSSDPVTTGLFVTELVAVDSLATGKTGVFIVLGCKPAVGNFSIAVGIGVWVSKDEVSVTGVWVATGKGGVCVDVGNSIDGRSFLIASESMRNFINPDSFVNTTADNIKNRVTTRPKMC